MITLEIFQKVVYMLGLPLHFLTGYSATRVTLHFLEAKRGWWNIVLLFAVHYFTMNSIVYIGDYLTPLFIVPGFVGAVCIFCKGRMAARFSMGMILVLLPLSINALLTNIRPPFDFLLFAYIAVLWCGILFFVRKVLPGGAKPPIKSPRLWALIDLLALMPFGSAITVIALTAPVHTNTDTDLFFDILYIQNERALLIILALSAIAALGLLVAVVVIARHERIEKEQSLWQMRVQYYKNMEQSHYQVKRMRHDMANHLTAMSGLDDAGMRKYLNGLISSPAMNTGSRFCENEVVNAVLANKIPLIDELRIDTATNVKIPDGLSVDDIDLCILFANSLDNAIEANRKLPENQRSLKLQAALENGFLMMELTNNYTGEMNLEHGQISTTKDDKLLHGFGLAGIREIAERYGGSYKIKHTQNSFCLLVIIPDSIQ